jgi:hypothetical protein
MRPMLGERLFALLQSPELQPVLDEHGNTIPDKAVQTLLCSCTDTCTCLTIRSLECLTLNIFLQYKGIEHHVHSLISY